jgi:hypothetical protein
MRPADSLADPSGRKPDNSGTPPHGAGDQAPSSVLAEAFARALRAAVATGAVDAGGLQATLRAFVAEMRARGEPPERALIAVKERVLVAVHRRGDVDRTDASALLRQIVHWTIEAYYRAD